MANFFIFVLQPRVVPPNQYVIHKYLRAPRSGRGAMTRAWELASFTPPARGEWSDVEGQKLLVESAWKACGQTVLVRFKLCIAAFKSVLILAF